jgi:uncharacterized membrane protein YphA (DoxX/SURF4 family)
MEKLKKAGRIAYCIGLAGMVVPQLFYTQFGNNFFPAWPHLPWVGLWSGLFTTIVLVACMAIIVEKQGRVASLLLGGLLLVMYCLGYIPYEIFLAPYADHLGTWGDGLKESALAGGAFVMAASFPVNLNAEKSTSIKWLEKLVPFGPLLFCITMILYGVSHFLYTKYISPLVPRWVPGSAAFWTDFAGAALICSGVAIVAGIKQKLVAILLGIMILIWLFIIHIPLVVADPYGNNANSIVSAFSALAFIGIAFVIAGNADSKGKTA